MIYLMLAILCSSAIALIFKHSEDNQMNRYAVTSANYLTAFTVSLILIIKGGLISQIRKITEVNFIQEAEQVIFNNQGIFSPGSSIIWAILVGVVAGIFFFLAFIYYQKSVRENGVGLAGTFAKLGILIPMSFSIILWREFPTSIQWIGIILSLASILIVNFSFKRFSLSDLRITLIFLFIFGGMAEFSNKIFQKYALTDYKDIFLFFVFFIAFWISIYFTIRHKKKVTRRDLLTGFFVGIPNLFSSFFLILSLNTIKNSVAFPVFSAGSIVVINLGGLILFKEKLSKKETIAVVLTIIALILINLK